MTMTAAAALPELLKFLAIVGAFFGACLALDRAFPPAPVGRAPARFSYDWARHRACRGAAAAPAEKRD